MPVTLDTARRELRRIRESRIARNLFAQAHAKRVLLDIGEAPEDFPRFDDNLDARVTWVAYELIAVGCTIAEAGERGEAASALYEGGQSLEHLHRTRSSRGSPAAFHTLLAAMAFYAGGQYSRAFVAMRDAEEMTLGAEIIGAFLRRDVRRALEKATFAVASLEGLPDDASDAEHVERGVTLAIARAIHTALEYAHSGEWDTLEAAFACSADALAIAAWGRAPAWWFVARLLRLLLRDLGSSSLWEQLPPYFPVDLNSELRRYSSLHALSARPAWELWQSQLDALPKVLDPSHSVVLNLPTSGGKTRLAELAILQILITHPDAKVLYLAPFRSLALEVEHTLSETLGVLGHGVSHLYGGSRVSKVDERAAAEAAIIIATPEKARAILRASPAMMKALKLIVIDEGHLLGLDARHVRNEIFTDHLRAVAGAVGARILLLSAVLPNAEQLASWVGGPGDHLVRSLWTPSARRLGALLWQGRQVRLEWRGETDCFNPRFVERTTIPGTRQQFPRTKNEAIASTAVRLMSSGAVLIFCGQARSVTGLAKSMLTALSIAQAGSHEWPDHEWRVFEAVCREDLPSDAVELRAAREGVLCHHAQLPPEVRLAMERLMRKGKARIVIATKTLAQGVNIGVASVIVATVSHGQDSDLTARDFWNICGRAGRAFVDGEGRVLYAIDETEAADKVRRARTRMESYFSGAQGDAARSGILDLLRAVRAISEQASVPFEHLLELLAENDLSALGEDEEEVAEGLDTIDDTLLALHEDPIVNAEGTSSLAWVDRVFRTSLGAAQALDDFSTEDLVAFMRARTAGVLRATEGTNVRRCVVTSGLPVRAALSMKKGLDVFRAIADELDRDFSEEALEGAVKRCEEWVRETELPSVKRMPDPQTLAALRGGWMRGDGIRTLCRAVTIKDDLDVLGKFYGYQLPWILHAAAQQLRCTEEEDRARVIDRLALLVELGLPNEAASFIYLAGVRSRAVATELSDYSQTLLTGTTIGAMSRQLQDDGVADALRASVSAEAAEWIELVRRTLSYGRERAVGISHFTCAGAPIDQLLHVRGDGTSFFLVSTDLRWTRGFSSTVKLPFSKIANDPRYAFEWEGADVWRVQMRDPRVNP